MAVPDTTTFTLQDVVTEIVPATDDLVSCFADSVDGDFDIAYKGAKDNLYNFRNYGAAFVLWDIDRINATTAHTANIASFIDGLSEATTTQIFVDEGGTRLYAIDFSAKKIEQMSLSVAHDLSSTITAVGTSSALTDSFMMLDFNTAGTKCYVTYSNTGGPTHSIREHALSTAWDITTMSTTVTSSIAYPTNSYSRGMAFKKDGLKVFGLYVNSSTSYFVHWTLSTAWDLSTAGSATSVDINTELGSPTGMFYIEQDGDTHVVCDGSTSQDFM